MATNSDRQIVIQLVLNGENPTLLEGLEQWIALGLLSERVVRQICAEQLVCGVPQPAIAREVPATVALGREGAGVTDFVTEEPPRSGRGRSGRVRDQEPLEGLAPARSPNRLGHLMQSFLAEVSVVWLLFLGVFLVVVSSGVLAATQWRTVPPVGQYGILLAYTVVFGLIAEWSRPRTNLQLTHRMLTIATLLLIPVNFWMMDGFRVGQTPLGLGVVAMASVGLTGLTWRMLRGGSPPLLIATAIALSWLHWGWAGANMPLVATYVGTVGAVLVVLRCDRGVAPEPHPVPGFAFPPLDTVAIALATLLLGGRAIFAAQVPIQSVGLALGLCGWLVAWLGRGDRRRASWLRAGSGLLALAWWVTVAVNPPWQAIAISGLALSVALRGVWRSPNVTTLTVGFLVGLQTNWLLWRLVPAVWQTRLVNGLMALAGQDGMPLALLGLAYFPYLMLTLGGGAWLRRRQQNSLATYTEWLALGLGTALTLLSLANPTVRSLNLSLSAGALGLVLAQRSRPGLWLVELTHGLGLAALLAWIGRFFPWLSEVAWVGILLGLMAGEWIGVNWPPDLARSRDRWQQSAWHWGLILAGLADLVLVSRWLGAGTGADAWNLMSFGVPLGLTMLAWQQGDRERPLPNPRVAGWLSVGAVLVGELLVVGSARGRIAGLAVGTVLLLWNTRQLQSRWVAGLTVGLGLGLWGAVWDTVLGQWRFSSVVWVGSATVLGLWGIRASLGPRRSRVAGYYCTALDGWAGAAFLLTAGWLTFAQIGVYGQFEAPQGAGLGAATGLLAACGLRLAQGPAVGLWWAIASSVELMLLSGVALVVGFPAQQVAPALSTIAIGNLALGFASLALGQRRLAAVEPVAPSWHLIPLVYAALGIGFGHHQFVALTGLYTAAGSLVVLGIGRRSQALKPLTYLAFAGFSVAAYEALVYRLLQVQGGTPGDGLVWLAGLAAGLALLYRWGLRRSRLVWCGLTPGEGQALAHSHWGVGTGFLALALGIGMSEPGRWQWVAIAALLAVYALGAGRGARGAVGAASGWTWLGIGEGVLAMAVGLRLLLPDVALIDWGGAIAVILGTGFCLVPWARLGWNPRPWHQAGHGLPVLAVGLTLWGINLQSLLFVGAFYAWRASQTQRIRLSYGSVLIANWAIARFLLQLQITVPFGFALLAGGSLLYLAQVDPSFQPQTARDRRHGLRSLATALICLMAFYQAEVGVAGIPPVLAGFGAIAIALGFVLAGLIGQIRAFLYIGTGAFMIQVIWQLWRFFSEYSLLLWLFGLLVGGLLIWGAATFEARRSQVNGWLEQWTTSLDDWA